jgi:hypothetical protein
MILYSSIFLNRKKLPNLIMNDLKPFVDNVIGQVSLETILPGIDDEWESAVLDTERRRVRQSVADYRSVARFATHVGIPFCVEPNPYYRTPHAVLHEVGHWAVKPTTYIEVYRHLSKRDFAVTQADVVFDERFGEPEVMNLAYYPGTNDRMPDWDLPEGLDPTPNEKGVRAWTRHAIAQLGLMDPIAQSRQNPYATQNVGDRVVAKGSSFRTWSSMSMNSPVALAEFKAFQLDPGHHVYRPDELSLPLPYAEPHSVAELEADVHAMGTQYPDRVTVYPGQIEEWRTHVSWKYQDLFLGSTGLL